MTDSTPTTDDTDDPLDREVFEAALAQLDDALDAVEALHDEVSSLDTPLSQSDTVALVYGRRNSLNKTDARMAFETLDDVVGLPTKVLLRRLLADLSDLTQDEAEQFLDELSRLERRYGDDD